jgi:hypothetical protein
MNIWSFHPFASSPRNNRLSENFFEGITKPKAYTSSEVSGLRTTQEFVLTVI